MTTDFDTTTLKNNRGFKKNDMSDKNNRITRTSNVWVYLTRKVKFESLFEPFLIYFSKTLTHHNECSLKQHEDPGIKEHLHHYPRQHHRYIKHTRQRISYMVWFMYLLVVSPFPWPKVSALQDRRVVIEPWPRLKTVSSTDSFISGLSPGSSIVTTREYLDRPPLDKDISRLIDRSEDIIKIQDEEEPRMTQAKLKPVRKSNDVRCPQPSFLEHGFIEGKDSRVGDTLYFRCKPGYKLVGPSRITCTAQRYLYRTVAKWDSAETQLCKKVLVENLFSQRHTYYLTNSRPQTMLNFWENISPWNLHSMQLKSMSNEVYRCNFPKPKGFCRGLVRHYYFNIRRLKCEVYHFGSCHDHSNQFRTIKECQQICSRLIYQ